MNSRETSASGAGLAEAMALLEAGRKNEAYAVFRDVLAQHPDNPTAQHYMISLLIEHNQHRAALFEMEHGILRAQVSPWLLQQKMRAQMSLGSFPEARQSFDAAVAMAGSVHDLVVLLEAMRPLFHRWQHPLVLQELAQKLARVDEACPEGDGSQAAILAMRLSVALRDYEGFLKQFDASSIVPEPWSTHFTRLASILRRNKIPDFDGEKVFGIGLSKTGTMSLVAALGSLGYLATHYANVFSLQMLREDDAFIFDAMCDTPVCIMFESLYYMFPNAKFIYTIRPYAQWLSSFEKHCVRAYGTNDFEVIRKIPTARSILPSISDFEGVDCNLYFRHANVGLAHEAYDARVRNFFRDKPAARLLEFDASAGHGWQELCAFLDRPIPAIEYPWDNRTAPAADPS